MNQQAQGLLILVIAYGFLVFLLVFTGYGAGYVRGFRRGVLKGYKDGKFHGGNQKYDA